MALHVSALAARAGVSADTVRYYEKVGLLPEPPRSPSGYREYDDDLEARIRFIKGAQRFGLRLADIRELLAIRDNGACPCGHTKTLLERRLVEVESEMKRLRSLRRELIEMAQLDCWSDPASSGVWPCDIEFGRRGGERDG